jgi:hypothetical protein
MAGGRRKTAESGQSNDRVQARDQEATHKDDQTGYLTLGRLMLGLRPSVVHVLPALGKGSRGVER